MTDAPKPPNRRRRKIIVAFVALVFVSMVSWWYWPRIDPRLVGQWRITGEGIWGHIRPSVFQPDGRLDSFMYRTGQKDIRQTRHYCWSVVGSRLVVAPSRPSIHEFGELAGYWFGRLFGGDERRYEIVELGPSEMILRDAANGLETRYVK